MDGVGEGENVYGRDMRLGIRIWVGMAFCNIITYCLLGISR